MTNPRSNVVLDKSFDFAVRISKLYRYLVDEKHEYVLSKELLIAGTHIGKHVKEAVSAESRQVFVNEFGAAWRKASETEYWLQLLLHAGLLSEAESASIESDRLEIAKLISKIFSTARKND
ncbi:MAG: four helix bundle protein [Pyrinomonadaceae bacterium]